MYHCSRHSGLLRSCVRSVTSTAGASLFIVHSADMTRHALRMRLSECQL
jgi:hypothetical protein